MNNQQVAHLWNAQNPERTGARGSHFFFIGPTIYSYGTHFPVAKIHSKRNGESLVLFNVRTYSVTTSQHQSYARSACSNRHSVTVPHVDPIGAGDHGANLDALALAHRNCLTSAQRRTSVQGVDMDSHTADSLRADHARYCAFFKVKRKPLPAFEAEFAAARARAERIENPDPASADKRERARAARLQRETERKARAAAERRAREFWRIGAARTSFRLFDAFGRDYEALRSSPCALRANGEQIETSWGARVPLAAAPMVWRMVQNCRRNGMEGRPHKGAARIGDYPLDRIDADGTLHAGCHTIPYSELAALAHQLGLAS